MDKTSKNKSMDRPRDEHGRFETAEQAQQQQKAKSQNKGGRSGSKAHSEK